VAFAEDAAPGETPGEVNSQPKRRVMLNEMTVEPYTSFRFGGGVSQTSWYAHAKVPGVNSKATYNISSSLFFMGYAEARYENTRLSLKYLKNRIKEDLDGDEADPGQLQRDATSYILGELDFRSPLSDTGSIRFGFERSRVRGTVDYKLDGIDQSPEKFRTDYERYELLFLEGDGFYFGFDYERYAMPSVIGFRDDTESVVYTAYDRGLVLKNIAFLIGHDGLSHKKKQRKDYSEPYLSGNVGLGIGWLDITDALKENAKAVTGKSEIDNGMLMYKAMLELGYFYKKEPDTSRDIGYSLNLGYRASYRYNDPVNIAFVTKLLALILFDADHSELPEDEPPDSNELEPEFRRHDLIHGPFIQAGIIF
jgi:hypothetical protein